jgi:hypothetical protein
MELMEQYGISEKAQKILAYVTTYNQLAYMFLTGNMDRTMTKSDYTDKLNSMLPVQVDGMDMLPAGISRTTRVFAEHGIVIKCDYQGGKDIRASIGERCFYETCSPACRERLAPLLLIKVGKSGKKIEKETRVYNPDTQQHEYKVIHVSTRRDDIQDDTRKGTTGKKCRSGRFILSVMVYAHDVRMADDETVNRLDLQLQREGIRDVHVGNVGRINGKAVCIDYAM